MRVALFRALVDAQKTAQRLAELGHNAVFAPVIRIVATGRTLPALQPDAVIFTSAHAVPPVAQDPSLPLLLDLPCFCVGEQTAAAVRALGFRSMQEPEANADGLTAAYIVAFPKASHALFITGRDRKPTLEHRLAAAGHKVTSLVVYQAEPIREWDCDTVEALGAADGALHYSRRSAELTLEAAARSGSGEVLRRLIHYCLSADVAEPLRSDGLRRILVASRPDEDALLATLDQETTARIES